MSAVIDTPATDPAPVSDTGALEAWLDALRFTAEHYHLPVSLQAARLSGLAQEEGEARIRAMAARLGLRIKPLERGMASLGGLNLPVIAELADGRVAVVTSLSAQGEAGLVFSGDADLADTMPGDELRKKALRILAVRPARTMPDARVDAYIRPFRRNWFSRIVFSDLRPYVHLMLASLAANCLALAGVLFSMQVYDRVVPAQSYATLYVLFGGVILAILFEFVLRRARMQVVDLLGRRADLRMSDLVFGHALRAKGSARPQSTGTFIAQLRDLEQVREMLTSTTVAAIADLPFFLLFGLIFWMIGGPLVIVPLVALVLLVVPGLLAQKRLARYATQAMRESSLRNAILVEAVQNIEDIKSLQAEERFQSQWNHLNSVAGQAGLELRGLTNSLVAWTQNVQSAVYASVICLGAPLVIGGDMTTGSLVALSILGSRMMAPMAQITQLLSRYQQSRIGLNSLNQIMQMPVDHPATESRVPLRRADGRFQLCQATFRYGDQTQPVALTVRELRIEPGEHIAVLGRNGAGKSTLLQALSGLVEASSGEITLDGIALNHIDPADLRAEIGLLTQNSRLFHGTIRDNLMMGAPHASSDALAQALSITGADQFVRRLGSGLDHLVLEGGLGLSGGQKQSLLLARLLLRDPRIVLLDEPTAALDDAAERHFTDSFRQWSAGRVVVIATHRMRVLDLVQRVLVVDRGAVTLDKPKEQALATLSGKVPPAQPANAAGARILRAGAAANIKGRAPA